MQVPFVLRFYCPDITDKIDLLMAFNPCLEFKIAVKMSIVVKQLLYLLKLFRVTAGCIHSFRIRSKETLRIRAPASDHVSKVSGFGYDPKNPPPLETILHFCKETKHPDLDLSKETHPIYQRKLDTDHYYKPVLAQSLGLIIARGQSVSGHVVQAKR